MSSSQLRIHGHRVCAVGDLPVQEFVPGRFGDGSQDFSGFAWGGVGVACGSGDCDQDPVLRASQPSGQDFDGGRRHWQGSESYWGFIECRRRHDVLLESCTMQCTFCSECGTGIASSWHLHRATRLLIGRGACCTADLIVRRRLGAFIGHVHRRSGPLRHRSSLPAIPHGTSNFEPHLDYLAAANSHPCPPPSSKRFLRARYLPFISAARRCCLPPP